MDISFKNASYEFTLKAIWVGVIISDFIQNNDCIEIAENLRWETFQRTSFDILSLVSCIWNTESNTLTLFGSGTKVFNVLHYLLFSEFRWSKYFCRI